MRVRLRTHALAAACALSVAVAGCAAEPLHFADWLLTVPEDTPIKEYAPVPVEERDPDAVRLIEDLVIGEDLSIPDAIIYEPTGVVAAPDGTIFIGDRSSNQIKMFDADGRYVKSLGNEGQGPGEFSSLSGMTIAGNHLLVRDSRNRRFSVWTLDGEHVTEHTPVTRVSASQMHGLTDGSFVSTFSDREEAGDMKTVVVRRTIEGEEISRLLEYPLPRPPGFESRDMRSMFQSMIGSIADPRILINVGAGEVAYISPIQEYQVVALTADGAALWALRVAWPREPFSDAAKQTLVENLPPMPEGQEPLRASDLEWPPLNVALWTISTDGAGRLYVFPQIAADDFSSPFAELERPVDVFSPDGDFIAAGVVRGMWTSAQGEYVYGPRENELDEVVIVRYRIEVEGR